MISSSEIVTLINALGLDPKVDEIDLKDLRYGKIIIMTDADVDGSHIRALLLTFFNNKPFNKLIEEGHIYLAPGDHHMVINPPPVSLGLNQRPKLNFMRPSADALFESAGKVFGEFCVAVILSGMGRDGARGAGTIKAGAGAVFVESPGKTSVPSMPRTALDSRVVSASLPLGLIGEAINHQVTLSNKKLLHRKREE